MPGLRFSGNMTFLVETHKYDFGDSAEYKIKQFFYCAIKK